MIYIGHIYIGHGQEELGGALVDDHGEGDFKNVVVVDGERQHQAHQLKLHGQVEAGCTEPKGAQLRIHPKHAKVGVKKFAHQQLEELLHACMARRG